MSRLSRLGWLIGGITVVAVTVAADLGTGLAVLLAVGVGVALACVDHPDRP